MSEQERRRIMYGWCIFVVLLVSPQVASSLTCPPGTFLYKFYNNDHPDVCVECLHDTFMPYTNHQETQCRACEKLEDPELEILVSPCNKTHDAVIHCMDGYYRELARNPRETGTCKRCTKCSETFPHQYTGQPCGTYRDTICCTDESFDVAPNHHGTPLCRERPWFCRQGQYFDTRGFQCLPCPSNTFMPEDYHVHLECFHCGNYTFEVNRPINSVIVQPCNSTHDTVLSCKGGFFIKHTMGYSHNSIGCSPCTDCSTTDAQYEGRKCDSLKDTVCCPQPSMTVVDTPDGPQCQSPSSSCGKGRCQQYNTRKRSVKCVPCDGDEDDEDVTADKLDDHDDDDFRRELTSDNYFNKTCAESDESRDNVALIVLAVLFGILLTAGIAFLIYYCYMKWKKYNVVPQDICDVYVQW